MKRVEDVARWCTSAIEEFGDPSLPICQLFFRYEAVQLAGVAPHGDLTCRMEDGTLQLHLGGAFQSFAMPIEDDPRVGEDGAIAAFGAENIAPGLWSIVPSLNAEGLLHAFIVLYDVPDPAPWTRRIVVP